MPPNNFWPYAFLPQSPLRTYSMPGSKLISGQTFHKWMEVFITSGTIMSQCFFPQNLLRQVGDKWDLNIGLCRFTPHAAEIMISGCAITYFVAWAHDLFFSLYSKFCNDLFFFFHSFLLMAYFVLPWQAIQDCWIWDRNGV